ncbi:MAG: ferric iron uptake transcriptional regulator [Gallionella sp.]
MESQELRNVGLKVTTPRLKMLELLENARDRHLSAEAIYRLLLDAGEEIGLATVYRALTQFEAAGLVTRHHFEGGQAVFELERGLHHDHIVCAHCGRVEEFYDDIIEKRQRSIAEKLGFILRDHTLTLYGECSEADCRAKFIKNTTGKFPATSK